MSEANNDETADRETELLERFSAWDRKLGNHWGEWRREARECYGFVDGTSQWNDNDKADLEDKGRLAPVFNRIGPIIDAVSGAEIMDRQQVQYFPRTPGASAVNELFTKGADWIRDRCNADQEETEAFRDAFICGMGWTHTRMDYDEDSQGQVLIERVDPLEMAIDPSSSKANGEDARYIRRSKPMDREAFEEAFPGATANGDPLMRARSSVNDPRHRYEGDDDTGEDASDDEVFVTEYQWYESREVVVATDPEDGELVDLHPDDFEQLRTKAREDHGIELEHVRQRRRVYYRAYVAGGEILNFDHEAGDAEVMEEGRFTYRLITGKRARNKRVWYGLVRPMKDPQRWANQFMSQLLAILASSTKGGVMLEANAVEDIVQFESSWAKPGENTYFRPGALSSGAVQTKPATPYPAGLERLIEMSQSAIKDTTGVNPEMLGLVDREQAGVLEHQRKQAAYGILAAFFDSFRRYRREHGHLLLHFIQYLPDGYLVRITDGEGLAQYVPLAKQSDTVKFDVIVDDAPAGPNQKAATFGVLMQLMPYLKEADLPADFWAEVATYTPLPERLTQAMRKGILDAGNQQPDPMAVAGAQADVAEKQAAAKADEAAAIKDLSDAARTRAELGVVFPPDQTSIGEPAL
jgi:hypothetical protein